SELDGDSEIDHSSPPRRSSDLVAVSPSPAWLGAAPGERLGQEELRALMKEARQAGKSELQTMRIRAGRLAQEPRLVVARAAQIRSEEHTSELQSRENLVCRLLL